MMNQLWRDLRYAVRTLQRTPAFAVVAIATLAIGIGANTAIFSVVNGVLLEPLPFDDADRLVGVWHTAPGLDYTQIPLSPDTYVQMRENNAVFEELALVTGGSSNVTGDGDPERIDVGLSTHTFFPLLGVEPQIGRLFTADEDHPDATEVALLSDGLWQRRYAGDPGVVGRTVQLDGTTVEIIGVLPAGFDWMDRDTDVWRPLDVDTSNPDVGSFSYNGLGKLLPDRSPEAAEANLAPLLERLLDVNKDSDTYVAFLENGQLATLVHPLKEDLVGDAQQPLLILLGSVAFVLLIACANVANLVIVRSDARRRELAVRSALGAGRRALARQFLAESGVLAVAGGLLGLGLAWVGVPALLSVAPEGLPRIENVRLDASVLAFTAGLVLLSVVLFGGLPLLRSFSASSFESLTAARGSTVGRDRNRLRALLVAGQTALALILLVGSGLMIRSFNELRGVDPGFEPDGVLTFDVALPGAQYTESPQAGQFHQQLLDRLATLPGVESVGGASYLPMTGQGGGTAYQIEDKPVGPGELPPMLWYKYVTPGYFETMGTRLLEGRTFDRSDHDQRTSNVVVNQRLADRVWPGESVVGKRLTQAGADTIRTWYTVVGVVETVQDVGLQQDSRELVYHTMVAPDSINAWVALNMSYAVRTAGPPTALAGAARTQVWDMDANLPVTGMGTLAEIVDRATARTSFTMMALAVAAIVALILGAIGLYGVVSYVVSERTREIGVRMALGAESNEVLRMVVTQGVRLAVAGLIVGLVASLAVTRLMGGFLYDTSPTDPLTFVVTSLVLLAVGVAASYLPARRASTIDPVQSLRSE